MRTADHSAPRVALRAHIRHQRHTIIRTGGQAGVLSRYDPAGPGPAGAAGPPGPQAGDFGSRVRRDTPETTKKIIDASKPERHAHQRKRKLSSGVCGRLPGVVVAGGELGFWRWRGSGGGRVAGCGHGEGPRGGAGCAGGGAGWCPPGSSRPYVVQAGSAQRVLACPDSVQPGWREGPGTGEGCPWCVAGSVPPAIMAGSPSPSGGRWSWGARVPGVRGRCAGQAASGVAGGR
jgi:hypothetical protein